MTAKMSTCMTDIDTEVHRCIYMYRDEYVYIHIYVLCLILYCTCLCTYILYVCVHTKECRLQ